MDNNKIIADLGIEIYTMAVSLYKKSCTTDFSNLKTAIIEKKQQATKSILHKIKGASLSIGLVSFSKEIENFENQTEQLTLKNYEHIYKIYQKGIELIHQKIENTKK